MDTQLLKGVLDLAVPAVVRDEDGYGYDIGRRLRTAGLEDVGGRLGVPRHAGRARPLRGVDQEVARLRRSDGRPDRHSKEDDEPR